MYKFIHLRSTENGNSMSSTNNIIKFRFMDRMYFSVRFNVLHGCGVIFFHLMRDSGQLKPNSVFIKKVLFARFLSTY